VKHWNYEVWHWRRGWIRGTVEATTLSMAMRRALQNVPDYITRLPKKGLPVTVKVTRID
jgi:hypothetical protein